MLTEKAALQLKEPDPYFAIRRRSPPKGGPRYPSPALEEPTTVGGFLEKKEVIVVGICLPTTGALTSAPLNFFTGSSSLSSFLAFNFVVGSADFRFLVWILREVRLTMIFPAATSSARSLKE